VLLLIELSECFEYISSTSVSFKPTYVSFSGLSSTFDMKDRPLSSPGAKKLDDHMSKQGPSTVSQNVGGPKEHGKPDIGGMIGQLRSSVGGLRVVDRNSLRPE